MVFGHIYLWTWYIGVLRAMQARNVNCVAALWQMARTTTVHLRHGLSWSQLAAWSIQKAEEAHHIEGVLSDSFPAFALKCLTALELPRHQCGATDDDGDGDTMTSRKACTKLMESKVYFRGSKMNNAMANSAEVPRLHL